MSYCAIENTLEDLDVCYDVLYALIHEEEPINEYERDNLPAFIQKCKDIVKMYDRGVRDGLIFEDGRICSEEEEDEEEEETEA
jgi:hypothetical protein